MFAVHGDEDKVVPYTENTQLLKDRIEAGGEPFVSRLSLEKAIKFRLRSLNAKNSSTLLSNNRRSKRGHSLQQFSSSCSESSSIDSGMELAHLRSQ